MSNLCKVALLTLQMLNNLIVFIQLFPGITERYRDETPLSAGIVRPIKPSQASRVPVSRLLNAVKARDFDLAEVELRKVQSRASALRTLASSSADKSRNLEGVRSVTRYYSLLFLINCKSPY